MKHELKKRIIALRCEKRLNQTEFADEISLSRTTLSCYEQGRREIRTDTLLKIAEYFDVSVEYLIGKTDCRLSVRSHNDVFLELDNECTTNGEIYENLSKLSLENRAIIKKMIDVMLKK
ncbi:MAG: helix-turn-helix domain-containing protein [Defluviitaleaceae bacterium]|nr:helix-turn-helix domain-containing protein [Defluviitaleaceae bacterium]